MYVGRERELAAHASRECMASLLLSDLIAKDRRRHILMERLKPRARGLQQILAAVSLNVTGPMSFEGLRVLRRLMHQESAADVV